VKVNLKHKDSGALKKVKLGPSWTTLFFGFFVPLIRGDAKWFLIMLLLDVVSVWLASLILTFTYNKTYIHGLLEKGFVPADDESATALRAKRMIT